MSGGSFAVIQVKPGIGDTIWHLPFIRAIAEIAPGGKVAFLAPSTSMARELLAAEPSVSDIAYFAHGGSELKRGLHLAQLAILLRSRNFQRIYILDRTIRPAFAAWLAGIPERIGIGFGWQRLWITNTGIDNSRLRDHPIVWLKALLDSEKIILEVPEPDLVIPSDVSAQIDFRFGSPPRPWLAIGIGASHPSKDWPDDHWTEFLQKLSQVGQSTIFLIGGPSCLSRADRLIAESEVVAVNACDLSIMSSAALIERSDLFIGPDSGPLNIAAAVGTRAYGIFGLTPSLTYSPHIQVIRASDDPTIRTPMTEVTPQRALSVLLPVVEELAR
jgi:lipopolysaccharide heptosyltransferase II